MSVQVQGSAWVVGIVSVVCLSTWPWMNVPYRIIYNPSESAPRGWYWERPLKAPDVDDFVLARLPKEARQLADSRHYLPSNVPLLKRIGAVHGQWICYRDGALWIDWQRSFWVRNVDGGGRSLPVWKACRRLQDHEFFLLSVTSDASFDSRYFGPVTASDVLGEAVPLWVW